MRYIILFDSKEKCYISRYTGYYEEYMKFERYTPILKTDNHEVLSSATINLNRSLHD